MAGGVAVFWGGLFEGWFFLTPPPTLAHNVSGEANIRVRLVFEFHYCTQPVARCGWREGKAMHRPNTPPRLFGGVASPYVSPRHGGCPSAVSQRWWWLGSGALGAVFLTRAW